MTDRLDSGSDIPSLAAFRQPIDPQPPVEVEDDPGLEEDRGFFEHEPDGPREIVVNGRHLPAITRDMLDALLEANDPPSIFVRSGTLARVLLDEKHRPVIDVLTTDSLRGRVARVADTVRINADGVRKPVFPPLEAIRDLAQIGVWGKEGRQIPPLEAVTEIPTLRPNGTIHDQAGYDPITRLLYIPARRLAVPPVSPAPDDTDLAEAVALVDDLLGDFPFDTTADRANAIGLLLTPIIRPAITGQVPLALIDAPEPGSGKGLLVNVLATIHTGRIAAMRPLATHDEEIRKWITSVLAEGPTVIGIDNVDDAIRAPSLALVLTSDEWADRILGRSETVTLPNRATWVATGNNIQVGGDLARRCYRIRLDAHQARPDARTDFRHPELLTHCLVHRGELIWALLTIVRRWYTTGKPPADTPAIGGFTPWARTIAGILAAAGIEGWLGNQTQFRSEADRDADDWDAFLTSWRNHFGAKAVTSGELVEILDPQIGHPMLRALPAELASALGRPGFIKSLGMRLIARKGRHYGEEGLHIVDTGRDRNKVKRWAVHYAAENLLDSTNSQNGGQQGDQVPADPAPLWISAGTAGTTQDAQSQVPALIHTPKVQVTPPAAGTAGTAGTSPLTHEKNGDVAEKNLPMAEKDPAVPAVPAGDLTHSDHWKAVEPPPGYLQDDVDPYEDGAHHTPLGEQS